MRIAIGLTLSLVTLLAGAPAPRGRFHGAPRPGASLPARLTDAEFRALVVELSEPDGVFRLSDNYSSNEMEVSSLVTMLRTAKPAGDVFVGVGPEQNFSYIAALRPGMAFICDIRHQAAMQHLMFKAAFELAPDRAAFISLLFARPRPAGVGETTPIGRMWEAFEAETVDPAAAERSIASITDRLTTSHGFTFTPEEAAQLLHVQNAFITIGPSITTRGTTAQGSMGMTPLGFADMTGRSVDAAGTVQTFLSSEENYRFVKTLQERNLVVPVTGDFAGPKALKAIGAYVATHGGTVSAFYVSNVEDYLFMDGKVAAFYENARALPVSATSVFIRPYAMRPSPIGIVGEPLCPIAAYLTGVAAGRAQTPADMVACAR